ncbi:MAG: hypothetical protein RL693_1420 [Verrucomicrobiota bacterium]
MLQYSLIFFICLVSLTRLSAEEKVRFNRDIRPIMSDTCFHCHGFDKNSRKGGLRLDIREEALKPGKSGEIPIVPGKPEESEMIKRIFTTDEDDLMPPDDAHKTLTPKQKDMFKRWVAEGAVYEAHWAYTPLVKPPVPAVQGARIENAIDAFIVSKLAENKIAPSAEADKRTLLRRLSLDIIGLPPTPEEMQAFLSDTSPKAYENQVDRLLKSPHYGERMAVWWLDVAHFSDTVGFHGDQNQRIFPYRDYVINAFNKNIPFSQFTTEQLAGDLLPNPTTEQLVATGFNRLNMMTREGGAQPKEYLAKYGAERVRTVSGAWLGSTFGCAECHDHKFDPIAAKDFYTLQAFFADVKQWGVYSDYGYSPNPELKGFNNEYPFPPEMEIESPYLKERQSRLLKAQSELIATTTKTAEADARAKALSVSWQDQAKQFFQKHPSGWSTPALEVKTSAMPKVTPKDAKTAPKKEVAKEVFKSEFKLQPDGHILFESKTADVTEIKLKPDAGWISAIKLVLLPDDLHKNSILRGGAQASATLKVTASLQTKAAPKSNALSFRQTDADHKKPDYASGAEIIGVAKEWRTSSENWNKAHTSIWWLNQPRHLEVGDVITLRIEGNSAGSVRVSISPFAPPALQSGDWMASLKTALQDGKPGGRDVINEAYFTSTSWDKAAFDQYKKLAASVLECRNGKANSMITVAVADPLKVRILPRGNWQDESGEEVVPTTPHFLPSFANESGKRLTRLDLAKWMCSDKNPLTPRAVMNRLWKQFYGNGLSAIVDDIGAQGEPPSHPELLDWVASEFRDGGWDFKEMIKLMVMSATYRQSSSLRPELRDLDPANRWLASQNPRRLDAEFVRDNALYVAGQLNLDMGGPSVTPYQPPNYYENLQFPNRDYIASTDDRQWRRGVYMHWQRTFLHPMLANFDAPMRDECVANRNLSNTPQQALTLLNDPTFVEAARVFAARLLHEKHTDDKARLNRAFELAVGRPVSDKAVLALMPFLTSQRELYKGNVADAEKVMHIGIAPIPTDIAPAELAAWTSLCRIILNMHETITRY